MHGMSPSFFCLGENILSTTDTCGQRSQATEARVRSRLMRSYASRIAACPATAPSAQIFVPVWQSGAHISASVVRLHAWKRSLSAFGAFEYIAPNKTLFSSLMPASFGAPWAHPIPHGAFLLFRQQSFHISVYRRQCGHVSKLLRPPILGHRRADFARLPHVGRVQHRMLKHDHDRVCS